MTRMLKSDMTLKTNQPLCDRVAPLIC
jgi:hypothetical protein